MSVRLTVDALAAERGMRAVFSDVSFAAVGGTLMRVTGANGAGKTTLLRILAGLGAAAAGCVGWSLDGSPLPSTSASIFVGHSNACHEALTVSENLAYAAALGGADATPGRIEHALAAFGVRPLARRRFGTLSQGQRKRASLARLLVAGPEDDRAWLLDEPFVALDIDTQSQLAVLIEARLGAGGLVVYTSHQTVPIRSAHAVEVAL